MTNFSSISRRQRGGFRILVAWFLFALAGSLSAQSAAGARRTPVTVLMVGDSLSVGGFGVAMGEWLTTKFGRGGFALYASCGSSPENWLRAEPVFYTPCGYREITPTSSLYRDYEGGHRPIPTRTPKIEELLGELRPTVVLVQLGTNWMDPIVERGFNEAKYLEIMHRFIDAVRGRPETVRQVIWVTPPDHSKYSPAVKKAVSDLIKKTAREEEFEIVDSARLTHYTPGETGGDGVHYREKEGREWAARVAGELQRKMRAR